jgi:hypothetical protein
MGPVFATLAAVHSGVAPDGLNGNHRCGCVYIRWPRLHRRIPLATPGGAQLKPLPALEVQGPSLGRGAEACTATLQQLITWCVAAAELSELSVHGHSVRPAVCWPHVPSEQRGMLSHINYADRSHTIGTGYASRSAIVPSSIESISLGDHTIADATLWLGQ